MAGMAAFSVPSPEDLFEVDDEEPDDPVIEFDDGL